MTKLKPACACPHAHRCQIKPKIPMTKLPDLMFWHLDIWISFGIWILKFGFFRQNLKMTNDKAQMLNRA